MYNLSSTSVKNWIHWHNLWIPKAIDTLCPFCNYLVSLTLERVMEDTPRKNINASGRCPRCDEESFIWIIKPLPINRDGEPTCKEILIYPPLQMKDERKSIEGIDKIPEPISRAYKVTIDVYNSGIWAACGAACRRTFEGVVKDIFDERDSKESLFKHLESLPEKVDLPSTLIHLAESLRKGGNISEHFDFEKEPDEKVAEAMLDLLEYIIQYVYIFKDKAKELEERLDKPEVIEDAKNPVLK